MQYAKMIMNNLNLKRRRKKLNSHYLVVLRGAFSVKNMIKI